MFLKSIELFGFKSFPDRTKIEFQNGISVILGPNGCGKSNIVDAVKWVVGEQSTKTLRAEKMEDVIFGGTENRTPLNVAEVTLNLLNDNGILPLDLPEISIKRRLFRNGESEYFLNKNQVRLREIKALFFDTGIGKSAYSVLEQGKIDQILSTKPEERRYIFEEAAGITKYKTKSQEAEQKLIRTEENTKQVMSILGEVRRSYETLEIQSNETKLYRELRNKIFEVDVKIHILYLNEYLKRRDTKQEILEKNGGDRRQIQSQIDGINTSMEESIDHVNRMESELIEAQKKLYGIGLEKTNHDNQIRIFQERIGELHKQQREDELREKTIREKIEGIRGDIAQKKSSIEKTEREVGDIQRNVGGFQKDIEHFTEKIGFNQADIEKNEKEMVSLEEKIEALRIELRKITDDIVTQMDQRLKEAGFSYGEHKRLENEIDELLRSLKIQVEGKAVFIEDLKRVGSRGETNADRIFESLSSLIPDLLQKTSLLSSLFAKFKKTVPSFINEFLAPQGIITKKREIDTRLSDYYGTILRLREANEKLKEENSLLVARINEYRKTLEELRINSARREAQKSALEAEVERLKNEIHEQEQTLERNVQSMEVTKSSIESLKMRVQKLEGEQEKLLNQEKELNAVTKRLEDAISKKNSALAAKEDSLRKKRAELERIQGLSEKIQIELAELKAEIKNIYQNFTEKYSRDLSDFEEQNNPIETPMKDLRADLIRHREELKNLGHVNLMAPEEFLEVKERFEFLQGQLNDLQKAREDLKKITEEIKAESAELFQETFQRIRKNFHVMLRRLFGGGRGELRLDNPDDVLEAGIEIFSQPPGKKLENINLLSGGERSLTGVALLFAVYLAKPSPFCILDEIDAALDEENVGRFVNLLREFAHSTQFVIITHNKRTIVGAESLLGITMEESGVSKLITARLKNNGSKG